MAIGSEKRLTKSEKFLKVYKLKLKNKMKKTTQLIIFASIVALLSGCGSFIPEQERLAIQKRNLSRELSKLKRINKDRSDIERLEEEIEQERYKY